MEAHSGAWRKGVVAQRGFAANKKNQKAKGKNQKGVATLRRRRSACE
jgi:hypothetical protein